MSLWWLQPGWTAALCGSCGVNIWNSGGDPDHGVCYECFMARYREPEPARQICEICKKNEACATSNGKAVCSQECHDEAERAGAQ